MISSKGNAANIVCLDFSKLPPEKVYVKIWINRRTAKLVRKLQEKKHSVERGNTGPWRSSHTDD